MATKANIPLHSVTVLATPEKRGLSNADLVLAMATFNQAAIALLLGQVNEDLALQCSGCAITAQAALATRMASAAKATGNPAGRAPTLYYGECGQRGGAWLLGVAQVAEFMAYSNANSCSARLAQAKNKLWLDRTIILNEIETVVAVRKATVEEVKQYNAANNTAVKEPEPASLPAKPVQARTRPRITGKQRLAAQLALEAEEEEAAPVKPKPAAPALSRKEQAALDRAVGPKPDNYT